MPTSRSTEPDPAAGDVPATASSCVDSPREPLTPDQVQRWAALIADRGGAFPADLLAPDRDRLAAAVRRRLRERLVTLVARAIAHDLYRRERGQDDPDAGGTAMRQSAEGQGGPKL